MPIIMSKQIGEDNGMYLPYILEIYTSLFFPALYVLPHCSSILPDNRTHVTNLFNLLLTQHHTSVKISK